MGSCARARRSLRCSTRTSRACIRSFVFNHMIHHRGQLTVYLRMLDVPLPALYGPSADEGQLG